MPVETPSVQVPPASIYLNKMNATIYLRLTEILDVGGIWKRLISVLPDGFYSANDVFRFEQMVPHVGECGPSSKLLYDMGNRGVTVGALILFLERMQLERALVLLKAFEPVRFIRQLPSSVTQQAGPGTGVRLECLATGFPRPVYQWFKFSKRDNDWIEINGQLQNTLDIRPLGIEDDGLYCCRASNENAHNDEETSYAFTNPCNIKINLVVRVIEKELNIAAPCQNRPEIIEHPTCPNKRPLFMGSSIVFRCLAEGEGPFRYQWYKNRELIKGADDSTIVIDDLQAVDDDVKFEVQCAVSNSYGMSLSKVAAFTLAAPVEYNQFSAEDKVALLIGNAAYHEHPPLICSTIDVATLAQSLRSMNFKVFCLINLTKKEMNAIVDKFCEFLRNGVYGLFYFAGHSFQLYGQNYMLPVDAQEECGLQDCLCLEDVQERMQRHDLSLCFTILDACRRELHQNYFDEQPPVIYIPQGNRNTVRAFSTSSFYGALDGNHGSNGVFMKHLNKHICAKKPLLEVLSLTKAAISVDQWVHKIQFPETSSTLANPLGLWDQVKPKSPISSEKNEEYEFLTETHLRDAEMVVPELDVTVLIEFPPSEFHNKLVLLMSARTSLPCNKTYVPIVHKFEPSTVEWNMNFDGNKLTVNVFNLQTITEPLVMIIKLCCDGPAIKMWRMDIQNPPISQALNWDCPEKLIPTDKPEESGFVSDLTQYKSNN